MVRSALVTALIAMLASDHSPTDLSPLFTAAHHNGESATAAPGREFSLTIPFIAADARAGKGRSHASYQRSSGVATLSLYQEPASSYLGHPALLWLRTRFAVTGGFTGRSALGAPVRVTVRHDQTDALGLVSAPETDVIPASKYLPAIHADTYRAEIPASIPPADVVARFEGTLIQSAGKPAAQCDSRFYEADIQAPIDVNSRICWANVRLTRVVFERRSTGAVIKEWNAPRT